MIVWYMLIGVVFGISIGVLSEFSMLRIIKLGMELYTDVRFTATSLAHPHTTGIHRYITGVLLEILLEVQSHQ